ncbi:MAG: hypothetical protein ACK56I_36785, partial [bacterium]
SQQRLSEFNRDPEKFISELTNLFDEQKKGTGKDLIEKQFAPIWIETPAYTQAQQEMIYETLNLMLKNKNKVFPDFHEYLKALIAFPTSGKTEADFLAWSDVLLKVMADKKNKKFTSELIESSALLFRDRTFFQNETIQW